LVPGDPADPDHARSHERDSRGYFAERREGQLDCARVRPLPHDGGDKGPQHHDSSEAEPDEEGDDDNPASPVSSSLPDDDAGTRGQDDGGQDKDFTGVHGASIARRGR
jgi:hypothetical protein